LVPAAAAATTAPAAKAGTIRVSMNGAPNAKDIPRLMAIDSLKEQGYDVEVTTFAQSALVPVAMQRGDIDIGDVTTNLAWTAIAKGTDIRSVVGEANMTFQLVTKQNIQSCQDLGSRTLAFSTRQAVGFVMFQDYVNRSCPGTSPQILLIADSSNRMASLESGKVDGAYLEIEDWLRLEREAPGKYRDAVDFGKEFPNVEYSTFTVRKGWAQQNPEVVKDYIRALLSAYRRLVGHPDEMQNELEKYIPADSAVAQEWANTFASSSVWDVNGALTEQNIQSTIDYLASKGSLPTGVKGSDVADLSYLNAVLDEIGRQ
jgi:ABC-type nitrate/sulfonate/bicarbonate transport system substrate-binding protein